ncbi:hypothetical protein [Bradyrhizobium sp. LMG 9283]|uniref:hypothetical protein n=1 Tax=Bradyrhizobium sp. LMG 9283 TaxID=592064 RepID=UPI00388D899F
MKLILILFLFVATIGLTLLLKYRVSPQYGLDVVTRFVERLNYIPSQKPALLSRDSFARWLADPALASAKDGYAVPVLFPFDLLFMICLAALLGMASAFVAGHLSFLSGVPAWIWWLLPLAYLAADLAEDGLLFLILRDSAPLTEPTFSLLRKLTAAKLATVSLAMGEIAFLLALKILVHFYPAE